MCIGILMHLTLRQILCRCLDDRKRRPKLVRNGIDDVSPQPYAIGLKFHRRVLISQKLVAIANRHSEQLKLQRTANEARILGPDINGHPLDSEG